MNNKLEENEVVNCTDCLTEEGKAMIRRAQSIEKRIEGFLLECPCCTEEEVQVALGLTDQEVSRGLKLLESGGKTDAERNPYNGEAFWSLSL